MLVEPFVFFKGMRDINNASGKSLIGNNGDKRDAMDGNGANDADVRFLHAVGNFFHN